MKNQYTLDISKHSKPGLTDCFKYDQLLMEMNAQVLSEYIPQLLHQIQFLYRKGHTEKNIFDFRQYDDDYFFIREGDNKDMGTPGLIHKSFEAELHSGQQSRFKFEFRGYTKHYEDGGLGHDYTITINDLEYDTPEVKFQYELIKDGNGKLSLEELNWYNKPHAQGDSAHLMRRLIRLVDGLEFLLTKEMDENDEWVDIVNNIYTPLSTLRDKTIKLGLVSHLFEIDKQLLRAEAIDKIVD